MSSPASKTQSPGSPSSASQSGSAVQISRRQQIMMKLEAKKREEEQNATFKPDLGLTSRSRSSTPNKVGGSDSTAFDRLYNRARASSKPPHQEEEHSFKPTLYTARSASAQKVRSKPSDVDTTTRLYTATGSGRRDPSSAPVEQKPSFSPQITKRAKSIERPRTVSSTDRLYAQAQVSKEKQEQLRESIIQLESAKNTFKPTLCPSPTKAADAPDAKKDATPSKPISERMKHYIEERNRKLEEAKRLAEAKAAAENTFRPQIQAARPVATTGEGSAPPVSVFERLNKAAVASKQPPAPKEEEAPKRPVSAAKTRRSISSTSGDNGSVKGLSSSSSIYDRLYKEAEERKKQLKAESDAIRAEQEKGLTFAPALPASSHSITRNSTKEVFERLSVSRSVDASVHSYKDQEEAEFTFKPTLNARSASFDRKHSEPVHLRLIKYAEVQQKKLDEEKKKLEEAELEGCTFEPYIPQYKTSKYEVSSVNAQDSETASRRARRESREQMYGSSARSARSQSPSNVSSISSPASEPGNRAPRRTASPASLQRSTPASRSVPAKGTASPASTAVASPAAVPGSQANSSPRLTVNTANTPSSSTAPKSPVPAAASPSAPPTSPNSAPRVIRPKAAMSPQNSSNSITAQETPAETPSSAPVESADQTA